MQFRAYLTPEQENTFSQLYGNQRFFKNKLLTVLKETYEIECELRKAPAVSGTISAGAAAVEPVIDNIPYMGKYDMYKFIPMMKKMWPFLGLSSVSHLRITVDNVDSAYQNYFKGRGGKPKFAKKKTKATLCFTQNVELNGNMLSVEGFRDCPIEVNFGRLGKKKGIPTTRLKKAYLKRDSDMRYYVTLIWVGEESPYKPFTPIPGNSIGLDEGINNLLVTSDGYRYKNPRALAQFEKAIQHLQRKLA